jgi:protein disulfide-isomerase A6
MVWTTSTFATSATVFALIAFVEAGLYGKNSAVIQVDGKSYDRLITQSNYTSVSSDDEIKDFF